jgi:hypothetical protein
MIIEFLEAEVSLFVAKVLGQVLKSKVWAVGYLDSAEMDLTRGYSSVAEPSLVPSSKYSQANTCFCLANGQRRQKWESACETR